MALREADVQRCFTTMKQIWSKVLLKCPYVSPPLVSKRHPTFAIIDGECQTFGDKQTFFLEDRTSKKNQRWDQLFWWCCLLCSITCHLRWQMVQHVPNFWLSNVHPKTFAVQFWESSEAVVVPPKSQSQNPKCITIKPLKIFIGRVRQNFFHNNFNLES